MDAKETFLRRLPSALDVEQCMVLEAIGCRNKMDHLHQNVVNLSNKAKSLPIYGALSFGVVAEAAIDGSVKKLKIVSITAGTSHSPKSSLKLINPIGKNFEGPIDFFQLEAFGVRVDLSSLVTHSKRVLDLFNTEIADEVRRQIEAKAIEAGLDVKAALEPKVSGIFAELTLTARSPEPGS